MIIFLQEWYTSINNSNKLDVFKSLNKHFKFEKYLSSVSIDAHRIALSRFRLSAHKLMIEEGRYRGIERNLRLCQFCNMQVTEDEYHFLLVCPAYRDIRCTILSNYYNRWPSKNKFVRLLNESQDSIIKRLAKFIYAANEKRTTLLSNVTT